MREIGIELWATWVLMPSYLGGCLAGVSRNEYGVQCFRQLIYTDVSYRTTRLIAFWMGELVTGGLPHQTLRRGAYFSEKTWPFYH